MILLSIFAFLSGLVTIASPCIWPILPIVLSASIGGKSHRRPLGIALGVIVSFSIATLTVSFLVRLFHFDPNILRLFAVIIISILGLSLLFATLASFIESWMSRFISFFGVRKFGGKDFLSGLLTGISLGIVWSPCAGPILAAVATLASLGKFSSTLLLITLSYVVGVGIPLFLFAYFGQNIFQRLKGVSSHVGLIQKVFGVIMILTALAIYTNYDVYLQSQLIAAVPFLNNLSTTFENNQDVKQQLDILKSQNSLQVADTNGLFNANTPAPDFVGGTTWLNSNQALNIAGLKGKVVLVDFWTYTCINCIRTLPHVTSWYDKYKQDGFVVIGVHTPEFQFEHETQNVKQAIAQYNIHYPVVQDNNYAIWQNYSNEYWPAEYLIDAKGTVRRVHFGEGEYDKMEMAIQALLKETGKSIVMPVDKLEDTTPTGTLSPETYLGQKRMQFYYPSGNVGLGSQNFSISTPVENSFSLGGVWNIQEEHAIAVNNSVLLYNFYASKVFLVMRPSPVGLSTVRIFIDGKAADETNAGGDVKDGSITVDADRLYSLVDLKGKTGTHLLRLEFSPGVQVFAFTFG